MTDAMAVADAPVAAPDQAEVKQGPLDELTKSQSKRVKAQRSANSGPSVACEVKGCRKKFYGSNRTSKLGAHRYAKHERGRGKAAKVSKLSPKQTEINQIATIITMLRDFERLSPDAQAYVRGQIAK